jgi:hypothetical protein
MHYFKIIITYLTIILWLFLIYVFFFKFIFQIIEKKDYEFLPLYLGLLGIVMIILGYYHKLEAFGLGKINQKQVELIKEIEEKEKIFFYDQLNLWFANGKFIKFCNRIGFFLIFTGILLFLFKIFNIN